MWVFTGQGLIGAWGGGVSSELTVWGPAGTEHGSVLAELGSFVSTVVALKM